MINKNSIQQHLRQGELQKAIDELIVLGKEYDSDLHNLAILQSGRLASHRKSHNSGTLTNDQSESIVNRIRLAVNSTVTESVDEDWQVGAPQDHTVETEEDNPGKSILFVASNPKDTDPLRLGEEINRIESSLERSKLRDNYNLEQQWATKIKDLRRSMLKHNPDIVHFSGHGSAAGRIILEEGEGYGQEIDPVALGNFFELFSKKTMCVILNACYSENQAIEIVKHIPIVIGMNNAIPDEAAIEFSEAFYDAIGAGNSFYFAFKLGVNAIEKHGLDAEDTPILLTQDDIKKASKSKMDEIAFFEELLEVLEVGKIAFQAQNNNARKLLHSLKNRLDLPAYNHIAHLFAQCHNLMTTEEKRHHSAIRGYTINLIKYQNDRTLELLEGHPEYIDRIDRLKYLKNHITIWKSKYQSLIDDPTTCLIYIGVDEKIGFPKKIEDDIRAHIDMLMGNSQ